MHRRTYLLLVLAFTLLIGTTDMTQDEAIQNLQSKISTGMSRSEVESILNEMGLEYVYFLDSTLKAMIDADRAFSPKPLDKIPTKRIQVRFPTRSGCLYETKAFGHIDLDEMDRLIDLKIRRGSVPKT